MIRNRGAVLPHCRSNIFLLQVKFFGETFVGKRLFDWIEVFSLNVFNQRHLEKRTLLAGGHIASRGWNARKAGLEGGAPPSLAGEYLKPITGLADDDRLDDTVRSDRLCQFVKPRVVNVRARLKGVRRETVDVDIRGRRSRF